MRDHHGSAAVLGRHMGGAGPAVVYQGVKPREDPVIRDLIQKIKLIGIIGFGVLQPTPGRIDQGWDPKLFQYLQEKLRLPGRVGIRHTAQGYHQEFRVPVQKPHQFRGRVPANGLISFVVAEHPDMLLPFRGLGEQCRGYRIDRFLPEQGTVDLPGAVSRVSRQVFGALADGIAESPVPDFVGKGIQPGAEVPVKADMGIVPDRVQHIGYRAHQDGFTRVFHTPDNRIDRFGMMHHPVRMRFLYRMVLST